MLFGTDPLSLPGFTGDGVFFVVGAVMPVQVLWVWGDRGALLAATFGLLSSPISAARCAPVRSIFKRRG